MTGYKRIVRRTYLWGLLVGVLVGWSFGWQVCYQTIAVKWRHIATDNLQSLRDSNNRSTEMCAHAQQVCEDAVYKIAQERKR